MSWYNWVTWMTTEPISKFKNVGCFSHIAWMAIGHTKQMLIFSVRHLVASMAMDHHCGYKEFTHLSEPVQATDLLISEYHIFSALFNFPVLKRYRKFLWSRQGAKADDFCFAWFKLTVLGFFCFFSQKYLQKSVARISLFYASVLFKLKGEGK